jgi:hypothetical protein
LPELPADTLPCSGQGINNRIRTIPYGACTENTHKAGIIIPLTGITRRLPREVEPGMHTARTDGVLDHFSGLPAVTSCKLPGDPQSSPGRHGAVPQPVSFLIFCLSLRWQEIPPDCRVICLCFLINPTDRISFGPVVVQSHKYYHICRCILKHWPP